MAKDIDNPDKPDLDEEEIDEEEGAETDEDIDEEDDSEDSEEDTDEEESDEDEDEEDSEDNDSEEGNDKDDEDGEGDDPMAKFKGKTAEQVIEMYKNLEKTIDKKANVKAQELVKTMTKGKKKPAGEKTDAELEKELEQTDFSKMTPKQFAKWTLDQINKRAMNKAQEIFEQASNVKAAVSREIKEAQRSHPHLKENAEYRDIVISLIESAGAKGKTLTLKEACEKADKAMGIKPKKKDDDGKEEDKGEDGKGKKKPRTGVEKTQGTDGKENETEEEKVRKGIMGGGQNKSDLGGLGI